MFVGIPFKKYTSFKSVTVQSAGVDYSNNSETKMGRRSGRGKAKGLESVWFIFDAVR